MSRKDHRTKLTRRIYDAVQNQPRLLQGYWLTPVAVRCISCPKIIKEGDPCVYHAVHRRSGKSYGTVYCVTCAEGFKMV